MHSQGVRWMKVCHPCNLSVQDYYRYRQLISRLPYTQSPWGPVTSTKGLVEISSQLQTELGRENLYTLFSCSPFSFQIENTLESLWSDIIDLHNIFLLFSNVNVHFSNIKTLIWVAQPEHCIETGNHFYIRVCYAERNTTLAWKRLEISHLKALFSPPQPKHFTDRGQRSQTIKAKPKLLSASIRKLSLVETQRSSTGLLNAARDKQ